MIPSHTFIPGKMRMSYGQEINAAMKEPGLLIIEHDIEAAAEVTERFSGYCEKQPNRVHAAPYLIKSLYIKGNPLTWAHRNFEAVDPRKVLPEKKLQKLKNLFPSTDEKGKPIEVGIAYPVYVAGGEAESDYFGLGFTYIPKTVWDKAFWRLADVDWSILDTRLSEACMLQGQKAVLHWDCLVNHTGIMRDVH